MKKKIQLFWKHLKAGTFQKMWMQTKWISQYARRYWKAMVVYTALGLAGTGVSLISSLISKDLVDIITGHQTGKLLSTFAAMIGFSIANILVSQASGYASTFINLKVDAEIKNDIFAKMMVTDWESLTAYHTGDLVTRWSSDASNISSGILNWIPNLIIYTVRFFSSLAIVVYYDPSFAVFALIGIPFSALLSRPLLRRMRNNNERSAAMNAKLYGFNQETFSNIQTIKAFDLISFYIDRLKNLQKEKESRTSQHKDFFEKRDYLSGQIGLLDKECYRLQGQMDKLEENREERIAYMWSEYEITPNNAVSYRKEELTDLSQMKRQAAQIKDDIRKLGPVNVNAIEDYKELLERHTFLSGQYEDLVTAEKTLEQIIQELDEGMRKQFSEKFGEIQKEFDKAFKELFGGGKGTLELDEEADILEAGIKIISQPPGKKLQNMMQLSGGEKALTAIALLFAIQNLKPSPFCLLDEIEAALDDSNVGRFAGYLQKLTKNTQFIIITHRRGTMNAADRLYGITMQEKGVSTLVSVDLVENQLTQ